MLRPTVEKPAAWSGNKKEQKKTHACNEGPCLVRMVWKSSSSWLPAKASSCSNSGKRPAVGVDRDSRGVAMASCSCAMSDLFRHVTSPWPYTLFRRPARPARTIPCHQPGVTSGDEEARCHNTVL